jgi:N-acetylglutamate synthase-like GNAT family acetyltransferase
MPSCPILPAEPADLPAVLDLLRRNGLPTEGVAEHFDTAVVARAAGRVVGSALVELYPDGALLRSVALDDHLRGTGLGHALTLGALALAARQGAPAAYLLTTTAAGFFPRLGFRRVHRDDVPEGVRSSSEFTHVCPSSSTVMARPLDPAADGYPCPHADHPILLDSVPDYEHPEPA